MGDGLSDEPAPAATVHGPIGIKLDAHLNRMVRKGYSGAVIVAKGGEIILRKGYGFANREQQLPVTTDTVFTIGSITKQFTGAAIVKLEMQGKLRVTDSIDKFFPEAPADKKHITIHQLLTHTAGMPDALGDDFDTSATSEAFLRLAMTSKLLSKPGTKHAYSNVGYSLLGMVIEKASGMGYEAYLRQHLFEPAGMMRTGYFLPKFKPDSLAVGYRKDQPWGTVLGHPMLGDGPGWHLRANGGIHSTVGDMYKWHLALLGTEILSDEARKKYFAPHVNEGFGDSFYGYGWVTFTTPRRTKLLAHNGGNGIFSADFRRYVDEDVVVFHATNSSQYDPDRVSDGLAKIIFSKR
jgi:CubicO group peptidase (beta-lactamase class C family)